MPEPATPTPARTLPPVLAPAHAPPAGHAHPSPGTGARPRLAVAVVAAIAAAKLAVHLVANVITPYGVHRDELLYAAMGNHLRVWAMDFPPFIALLGEVTRATFGDTVASLRAGSALAGAATVGLAAVIARTMGGHRVAQALAALAVLASPLFLRAANLFQPVVFDQLWWTAGLYVLARLGLDDAQAVGDARHNGWVDGRPHHAPRHTPPRTPAAHGRRGMGRRLASLARRLDRPTGRWWVLLGLVGGVGLLTKFSIAFFAAGALAGLAATPLRRMLRTPWPWLALAIAVAVGSPSLVGQIALGWPVLGQMRELRAAQLDRVGPLAFLGGQLAVGPAVVLAGYGLWHLLATPAGRPFRVVGWTAAAAFALLLVLQGKPYYVAPIYPALFAAGAVALERATHGLRPRRRQAARGGVAAALALLGLVMLPIAVPILAPPALARYTAAIGAGSANVTNVGERLEIPQDFADMLGWPSQASTLARVYDALPGDRRADAVIIAGNYGQAGAAEFYGPRLGLPRVVSAAGSFWFFGPGDSPGTVALAIGVPPEVLRRYYRIVTPAARVTHDQLRWVVPEERDVVVYVCEAPYRTLQEVWPSLRPQ